MSRRIVSLLALPVVLGLALAGAGTLPAAAATSAPALVINEVESNGDAHDWVELYNTSDQPTDASGLVVTDDKGLERTLTLPAGTVVAGHGFLTVDVDDETVWGDAAFGLGKADEVHLFWDGTEIDAYAWTAHADETYGRCPDGTGAFAETEAATPGAVNQCPASADADDIRINEIESNGDAAGDWVELVNVGDTTADLGGYVLRDSDDAHGITLPAGTTLAAGARLSVVTDDAGTWGDAAFGLGKEDAVRLFAADGTTLVDAYSWTAHAATTYARCPDGTGEFATSAQATRDAVNACAGEVAIEAWPGSDEVSVIDDADTFADDLSGLFWEDGALWAVDNGSGTLSRLVDSGATWAPAETWTLRYPDGTGAVDAEGVTRVDGTVYVASERDNDASGASRPSVLAYEPEGTGELAATAEWNLAALLPAIGANAGLEGIAWIPDATLVAGGFVDASTGAAYDPAGYDGHGDGLFFVGVEGTGRVYAVALLDDGQAKLVATIDPGLGIVAEVAYDASSGRLWAVCDDACGGETAVLELASSGAFEVTHHYANPAGMVDTIANEGFALGECVDGERTVYYADDADTDGHSLRQGALDCAVDEGSGSGSEGGGSGGGGSGSGGGGAGSGSDDGGAGSGSEGGGEAAAATPSAPAESALTEESRGAVSAPASATAGQAITVTVGAAYAGQTVYGWLFSTPVALGAAVVSDAGTVSFVLPDTVAAGAHRLAVSGADGALIGWTPLVVRELAATGGTDTRGWIPVALAAVALGGILLLGARARRRSA